MAVVGLTCGTQHNPLVHSTSVRRHSHISVDGHKHSLLSSTDLYPRVQFLVFKTCVCSHVVMRNFKPTEDLKESFSGSICTPPRRHDSHSTVAVLPYLSPSAHSSVHPLISRLLLRQPYNFKGGKRQDTNYSKAIDSEGMGRHLANPQRPR